MKLESIYKQIDEQREALVRLLNISKKNPIPPNRLSDVCMKLSILNELLGGHIPELKAKQLEKERKVFEEVRDDGKSATEAREAARHQSSQERFVFEKADTKHSDLWKLISMAQSHIRAEGQEQKGL